ncbi:MAG TPA: DUF1015 family protein [Methanoregulaceae archaeon]|nr:DUF1015 family protein [Methanoregulaceae archaeon]
MVAVYPFSAVRPKGEAAQEIAAVPYDVVTADEARAIIAKDPQSFLRVSRSDAELPGMPANDERVYRRAADNFRALMERGCMEKDPSPTLYLYRVQQDREIFLGIACCLDVEDYRTRRIRRHEQTRYDKEEDRTRHIEATKTHNGPVVLLYRDEAGIAARLESLIRGGTAPVAEVHAENGTVHQIFRLDPDDVLHLVDRFSTIPYLYIADGHHRAKSAVNVADRHAGEGGHEGMDRFLGVLFAHDCVRIHGYSRLLTDIGGYTTETFLSDLRKIFAVEPYGPADGNGFQLVPRVRKSHLYHIIHVYLEGAWYECTRPIDPKKTALETLDVAILQEHILGGMLGISDPRGDARLQYLGGARPIRDLMALVDNGDFRLAIAMQPVRVDTVLAIADADGVMPPKSTWFEPKLLSGLLVHTFD